MTPMEAAFKASDRRYDSTNHVTFHLDEFLRVVATAIEEDRAANAPLLAAAEVYRAAWAARPSVHQGNYLNRMEHFAKARDALCAAARAQPAQTPSDFSKEPWNI